MTWSFSPESMATRIVCSRLLFLGTTESTNLVARQLAEEGTPEGTVVLADCQTGGKGRLGRPWLSPPGVNFYGSVVLRPAVLPRKAGQITFITSLAAAGALRDSFSVEAQVKWPNDILLNGKKIGGVLNELCASQEKINYLVLGLGVNLNMTCDQLPERELFPATSVMLEQGEAVSRELFARNYFQLLDRLYFRYFEEGFSSLRKEWESYCGMIGRRVDMDAEGRSVSGEVLGIDEEGFLLLRGQDGREERLLSADIRLIHD
ncbi:MAG: biotin--[acetyl-CoA-carboxylase] ligase [Deltaproteobacteria bacterium]|nr:biotin--[acetyl-CoA-carboxylase] ligase [Deltaproteobacteria bacterium]